MLRCRGISLQSETNSYSVLEKKKLKNAYTNISYLVKQGIIIGSFFAIGKKNRAQNNFFQVFAYR